MSENYLTKMTNVELAQEYATHKNAAALKELEKREMLSAMTFDERMELALKIKEGSDKQMVFDFADKQADNLSVKDDQWEGAYEAGFRAGAKCGISHTVDAARHGRSMKSKELRELRFCVGDYVRHLNPEEEYNKFTGTVGVFKPPYGIPKEEYKEYMRIVAIPANIMTSIHDYTVNRLDSRGMWSTSCTVADSDLESASKEEIRIWSEKMRKGFNEKYPDHHITGSLEI